MDKDKVYIPMDAIIVGLSPALPISNNKYATEKQPTMTSHEEFFMPSILIHNANVTDKGNAYRMHANKPEAHIYRRDWKLQSENLNLKGVPSKKKTLKSKDTLDILLYKVSSRDLKKIKQKAKIDKLACISGGKEP